MSQITVKILANQNYIELGNLLKFAGVVDTGGYAKVFLKTNEVYVNDELENRRGRKLYHGDVVKTSKQKIIVE